MASKNCIRLENLKNSKKVCKNNILILSLHKLKQRGLKKQSVNINHLWKETSSISFRKFGRCELEIIHKKGKKKLENRIDVNIIFWMTFFSYFFKIMIDIVTVREIENSYTKKLLTISHEEVGMF